MFGWFKKKAPDPPPPPGATLRPVAGAGVFRDNNGQVIYNLLDPVRQQFLGRCVRAIKQAGVRAKGTGSFSVLLGEDQKAELSLDRFWKDYCDSQDADVFARVAEAAKQAAGGG
jgi:hypothetical protein